MEHLFRPLYVDSAKEGRYARKKNNPLFVYGKGITKKPSDAEDVSKSKIMHTQEFPKVEVSIEESRKYTKNAKEIKSRTGNIEDNKWMWIFMKRARQV